MPVPSFLIDHPQGKVVFDTGLRVDGFLANSQNVAGRIGRLYGREAAVVPSKLRLVER